MKTEKIQNGFYRGFELIEKTETTEQSDMTEVIDWVKSLNPVGSKSTHIQIIVKGAYLSAKTVDDAKKYIDKIMAKDEDEYDDGLDRVDDSPSKYFGQSYCVNPTVTCYNCSYVNYNRDCKNNKVII